MEERLNESDEIAAFRRTVERYIENNVSLEIGNSSPAHARVLIDCMFRHAQKTAYVFCGCLSNEVWGDERIAASVEDAIGRGVEVVFLVQRRDDIPGDSPVKRVLEASGNRILSSPLFAEVEHHFAVFDGQRYRFEYDDGRKMATACMYAPLLAGQFLEVARRMAAVSGRKAEVA